MKIGSFRINRDGDSRVAIVPASVTRLVELGAEVLLEAGLGEPVRVSDQMYSDAGATVCSREEIVGKADITHMPSQAVI